MALLVCAFVPSVGCSGRTPPSARDATPVADSSSDLAVDGTAGACRPCVTTLAGSQAGFEDGPARSARFWRPLGVAVGPQGTVFVADTRNYRVRAVSNGTVSTLAGSGSRDWQDGPAMLAAFDSPVAVAVDGSRVYVSDSANHVIRVVDGGRVRTIAGQGKTTGFADGSAATARFALPQGIAVGQLGRLYIADFGNNRIRSLQRGVVSTIAGSGTAGFKDGKALEARLHRPRAVATSASGGAQYTAGQSNRIRLVAGGVVSTLAGTGVRGAVDGPAAQAQFADPSGIAVDRAGVVYVADANNHRVRVIRNGIVATYAGTGRPGADDGPGAKATFDTPRGIAVDAAGRVYVADTGNNLIRLIKAGRPGGG